MQTFEQIHDRELKEQHRMLLYFAAFLIATVVVVASLISSLAG